jgi:hypothetical protein
MESSTMRKVVVTAKIENLADVFSVKGGRLPDDQVRRIEVTDAVVDTRAARLLLPKRMIAALGLERLRTRHLQGIDEDFVSRVKGTVRLTIQERDCVIDVGEIGDGYPVRIGHIALTALDWVVDTKGGKLIGNPDHGGEWGMDAF